MIFYNLHSALHQLTLIVEFHYHYQESLKPSISQTPMLTRCSNSKKFYHTCISLQHVHLIYWLPNIFNRRVKLTEKNASKYVINTRLEICGARCNKKWHHKETLRSIFQARNFCRSAANAPISTTWYPIFFLSLCCKQPIWGYLLPFITPHLGKKIHLQGASPLRSRNWLFIVTATHLDARSTSSISTERAPTRPGIN